MFSAIKDDLNEDIEVVEIDCNINDAEFSTKAVEMMLGLIERKRQCAMHTLTERERRVLELRFGRERRD